MVGKVVAHEIVGAKFIIWIKPHIFLLACTVLLNLASNFIAPLGTHSELWSELSVNHWTDFWTVALLIYGKVFVQNSTRMIVGYVIQGRLDIVLWSLPFLGVCYKLWPSLTPMVSLTQNALEVPARQLKLVEFFFLMKRYNKSEEQTKTPSCDRSFICSLLDKNFHHRYYNLIYFPSFIFPTTFTGETLLKPWDPKFFWKKFFLKKKQHLFRICLASLGFQSLGLH